jgi:nucleoside phosphorylase
MGCEDIAFFFATLMEAQSTIDRLKARQISENRWALPHGEIVITGMGKENVLKNAHSSGSVWINLGIAGAFSEEYSVGEAVWIKSVSEYPCRGKRYLLDGDAHLYTASGLVDEKPNEEKSLVDMEGYFLAEIADANESKLLIGKVVSDHCSKDSSALIKSRLPELSKTLALLTTSVLNSWNQRRLVASH